MNTAVQSRLWRRLLLVPVLALTLASAACGGGDSSGGAEGTYKHDEEGTIVLESGGDGSISQSGDPVEFKWEQDGDTIQFSFDGEVKAEATLDGDNLTFRPGDFSGDEAVTFVRQD